MAIREYFLYRSDILDKKLNTILKLGLKSLLVGLSFLLIAILASAGVENYLSHEHLKSFLKEGLILIGWVSMWKPINIFLYEWWPLAEGKTEMLAISNIDVKIIEVGPESESEA